MTIEIINIKNPKYIKEDNSIIEVQAQFSHLYSKDNSDNKVYGWHIFGATATDVEEHGKTIYANAENGDYGTIATYEHPSFETEISLLREKRNELLFETDWTQSTDVPQATKDKFATYRQELRDLTEGIDTAEKARAVTFPTKPE